MRWNSSKDMRILLVGLVLGALLLFALATASLGSTGNGQETAGATPSWYNFLPLVVRRHGPLWTPTPTSTPTDTPTPTSTPTDTPTPTSTPTDTPTPTSTPVPTDTPAPTPGVYVLDNSSSYADSIGYLHVVGEVQNDTTDDLKFVRIAVNVFDSQGALVGTTSTYTQLRNLPAGERACFNALMKEPASWDYYEFESPTYWTTGDPLPNLTAFNHSAWYNATTGRVEIIGQVRNDHGSRVEYVRPVGTLYDATNTVVGCTYTYVNTTHLDPDQVSSFKMLFVGRDYSDAELYRLQVDGRPK